jgi:hypothetical protein
MTRKTSPKSSKSAARSAKPAGRKPQPRKALPPVNPGEVRLLSGGNPQIAKGYGDEPVQAYIAAMPGWKSAVGRRLDAIITAAVPNVSKAVKWNSPMYGVGEGTYFMGIHCFAKYIKVAFFFGASLSPQPPGESKQKNVRYLDIHEKDVLDEAQFAKWVKQASEMPGEKM